MDLIWLHLHSVRKFKRRHVPNFHISRLPARWTKSRPPRAHFNDGDARETRLIGICTSAGPSPCLHHLPGTQHETCFCLVL
ncbi:hypothetical protein TNCV_3264911 [Trichonephila clavipes]|nr:hypothetical protein TNCV_3264911 [Trichonephila clavipes]